MVPGLGAVSLARAGDRKEGQRSFLPFLIPWCPVCALGRVYMEPAAGGQPTGETGTCSLYMSVTQATLSEARYAWTAATGLCRADCQIPQLFVESVGFSPKRQTD